MIKKIILRNFKRFQEEEFSLDPRVVLAGHNNNGKTTLIQAIAAWHFALHKWLDSGNIRSISLSRNEFAPVPLREFNQLWTDTITRKSEKGKPPSTPLPLEIEVHGTSLEAKDWQLTMEFKYSNKDQIYAKPKGDSLDEAKELNIAYIPSFSGIGVNEPEHSKALQDVLIGQGKPGDILRNLLLTVYRKNNQKEWDSLCEHIRDIFNCELLPPSWHNRAYILCEYHAISASPLPKSRRKRISKLDINTAGSGFQQVLLLLAFLYARPAMVLLIDEPDAHLHLRLQSDMHSLLSEIADKRDGQLIIATHSEVFIEETDPKNVVSFMGKHPHRLADKHARKDIQTAMRLLSTLDLLKAKEANDKVLLLEGKSDLEFLRVWAKILNHPLEEWLQDKNSFVHFLGGKRLRYAIDYDSALRAVYPKIRSFVMVDPNSHPDETGGLPIYGEENSPRVLKKWERYEIENYLVIPEVICRFIEGWEKEKERLQTTHQEKEEDEKDEKEEVKGGRLFPSYPVSDPQKAIEALKERIPPKYYGDLPNDPSGYLKTNNSSDGIFPAVFQAANVLIDKKDYYRIAKCMREEEIHQDVRDMLDAIASHLNIKAS